MTTQEITNSLRSEQQRVSVSLWCSTPNDLFGCRVAGFEAGVVPVPVLSRDDNDVDRNDHRARNKTDDDQALVPLKDADDTDDRDDRQRQNHARSNPGERPSRVFTSSKDRRRSRVEWS